MEGSVNGFILVSISFHAIPVIFMIEYTVLATRQKLKLLDTLNTFKIANTKCFDPNDRTVVEKARESRAASLAALILPLASTPSFHACVSSSRSRHLCTLSHGDGVVDASSAASLL